MTGSVVAVLPVGAAEPTRVDRVANEGRKLRWPVRGEALSSKDGPGVEEHPSLLDHELARRVERDRRIGEPAFSPTCSMRTGDDVGP